MWRREGKCGLGNNSEAEAFSKVRQTSDARKANSIRDEEKSRESDIQWINDRTHWPTE